MNWLRKVWHKVNGSKTLLGLALLYGLQHSGLSPSDVLYAAIRDIAYSLLGIGLVHKVQKGVKRS